MKKIILSCFLLVFFGGIFSPNSVVHAQVDEPNLVMQPRAAIKKWKYKYENGSYYKRLYNYSTGKWEGGWIRVS